MPTINFDEDRAARRAAQRLAGSTPTATPTTTPTTTTGDVSVDSGMTDGATNPYEFGGVTGFGQGNTVPGKETPTVSASLGQYANALQGFDTTKLANVQHTTPKYQFARIASGYAPTPEGLTAMANSQAFKDAGFKLVGKDKIQLTDGSIIDVGTNFSGTGNKNWAWQPTTGPNGAALAGSSDPYSGSGYSGSGGTYGSGSSYDDLFGIGGVGANLYNNMYNDPYTNQLEQFVNQRLQELYQPVNDPLRNQYGSALQKVYDQANGGNTEIDYLRNLAHQQAVELSNPNYTSSEQEVIRTQALDPIERDRTAAKQRMLEQLSARGLNPDSGIAQEALLRVDAAFDASRASAQGDIALNEIQRREGRMSQALDAQGTAANAYTSLNDQSLSAASVLEQLSRGTRSEEQARRSEALSLVTLLAELGPQRMKEALAVLGMGETPGSLLDSIAQINSVNNQNYQIQQQGNSSFWQGLGSLAALIGASSNK